MNSRRSITMILLAIAVAAGVAIPAFAQNVTSGSIGGIAVDQQNAVLPFRFDGIDAATGRMIYNLSPMKGATFRKFETDDPRSRYQAQLGVRYRF